MIKTTYDIRDLTIALEKLGRKAKVIPMSAIAIPFVNGIENEIRTEGRGTWAPFAEATLRMHPRRKGGKLLQDTGALANIQVDAQDATGTATISSPAEYAWKHANGYKSGRENIPQRDYLDIEMDKAAEEASIMAVLEIDS